MNTTTNMIQVRGAYYIESYSNLMAIEMPDGTMMVTETLPDDNRILRDVLMPCNFAPCGGDFADFDEFSAPAALVAIADNLYPVYGLKRVDDPDNGPDGMLLVNGAYRCPMFPTLLVVELPTGEMMYTDIPHGCMVAMHDLIPCGPEYRNTFDFAESDMYPIPLFLYTVYGLKLIGNSGSCSDDGMLPVRAAYRCPMSPGILTVEMTDGTMMYTDIPQPGCMVSMHDLQSCGHDYRNTFDFRKFRESDILDPIPLFLYTVYGLKLIDDSAMESDDGMLPVRAAYRCPIFPTLLVVELPTGEMMYAETLPDDNRISRDALTPSARRHKADWYYTLNDDIRIQINLMPILERMYPVYGLEHVQVDKIPANERCKKTADVSPIRVRGVYSMENTCMLVVEMENGDMMLTYHNGVTISRDDLIPCRRRHMADWHPEMLCEIEKSWYEYYGFEKIQ